MRNARILLVCCLFSQIASSDSLGETADLGVHVIADKSTLVLGEPLYITAHVHNEGKAPVKVYRQNSPTYEMWSSNAFLIVISEDGVKYDTWSDAFRPVHKSFPIELSRGGNIRTNLVILFNSRHEMAFKQPGEYWVSVKVIDTDMTSFQAEPTRITVTKPDRQSLAAWNILGSEEFAKTYGRLVQVPWDARLSGEDLQQCDHILETYPDSIYAQYLALSLGRSYREGPKKDKAKATRYLELARDIATSDAIESKAIKALEEK